MKKIITILTFLFPLVIFAQQDTVVAKLYKWKDPVPGKNNISSAILFRGSTIDLASVQMTANRISYAKMKTSLQHSSKESLLIVRSGSLIISMKDSSWTVGKGSVALIMPEENCSLQSATKSPCEFYLMTYQSKLPADPSRAVNTGASEVVDWNKVVYKPNDKGGTRKFLERPTAMLQRLEMHVSTLNPGLKSHDPHTHRAAEIILVLEGNTEMLIGNTYYKGNAGDVYYMAPYVLHGIRNDGKEACTYFAFQFQ